MIVGMRVFIHIFVSVSKALHVDNSFELDLNGNNMKWHCDFGSFRSPANLLYFFVLFSLFGGVHFFPTLVCKINVFCVGQTPHTHWALKFTGLKSDASYHYS